MLYFLQTLGLLAAAGLLLPIVIHLWNKKAGKTLKIGSVQLLVETARQQARSLRLKDLWLLLLRCLVVLLLALVVAKPMWQQPLTATGRKGWVVLDNSTPEAYRQYKPLVDSLLQSGYEAHRFSINFPLIDLTDTTQYNPPGKALPYWSLLKALNEQVPDSLPVVLITSNRLHQFAGNRPVVGMNLQWLTYAASDTMTGNPVAARLLTNDSIAITIAHSTAAFTAYRTALHKLGGSQGYSFSVDTSTLRVAILADPGGTEAGYLKAALLAIRQFSGYQMQVETATNPAQLTGRYNWVFWLSPKALPRGLAANNVLQYGGGKEKSVTGTMLVAGSSTEPVPLQKMLVNENTIAGEMVWQNGAGEPVLTKQTGPTNRYFFYSRFNPAWNGLVWSESFPVVLFGLMLQQQLHIRNDHRTIDASQLLPARATAGPATRKPQFTATTNLSPWAWAVAFVLFAVERFISLRTQKPTYAR